MENITVLTGTVKSTSSGHQQDRTREVEFVGEKLGAYREFGDDERGNVTDTRGVTETLYQTDDDRLVVHVRAWSQWSGEPNIYSLHEVTKADLEGSGRFAQLGHATGHGRPLTLAEALSGDAEEYGDDELSDAERLAAGQPVLCTLCRRDVQPGEGFYSTSEGAVICMDCSESGE